MEGIISTFHLDWKLIIAQLVNFAIVVGVLWYFAFKPLAKTMSQRTDKIEKSLKDAAEIETRLKAIQKEREDQIITAKKEAEKILNQIRDLAEKQRQETVQRTKEEVAKTVELAKTQIASEKEKMIGEVKTEVVELISQAAGKILEKVTDKKIDKAIIENTLKEIGQKPTKQL